MINIIKPGGLGLISVWAVGNNQAGIIRNLNQVITFIKWHKPYDIENKRQYDIYSKILLYIYSRYVY